MHSFEKLVGRPANLTSYVCSWWFSDWIQCRTCTWRPTGAAFSNLCRTMPSTPCLIRVIGALHSLLPSYGWRGWPAKDGSSSDRVEPRWGWGGPAIQINGTNAIIFHIIFDVESFSLIPNPIPWICNRVYLVGVFFVKNAKKRTRESQGMHFSISCGPHRDTLVSKLWTARRKQLMEHVESDKSQRVNMNWKISHVMIIIDHRYSSMPFRNFSLQLTN